MQTFINRPPALLEHKCTFPTVTFSTLRNEPSLRNCDDDFVATQGGPLAKRALEHILVCYYDDIRKAKQAGLSAVCEVRVQTLLPEMFPYVPGWHCDGVPRSLITGQPKFEAINPASFHVALTLSTEMMGVSNTEYVMDPMRPKLWDEEKMFRELHNEVERVSPRTRRIVDGQFVKYWPKTIHRATPVDRRGMRVFFRFSMCEKPEIQNLKDAPQQVYLLSEKTGW